MWQQYVDAINMFGFVVSCKYPVIKLKHVPKYIIMNETQEYILKTKSAPFFYYKGDPSLGS